MSLEGLLSAPQEQVIWIRVDGLEVSLALSPAFVRPLERAQDEFLAAADRVDAVFRAVWFRANECAAPLGLSAELLADFPGFLPLLLTFALHRLAAPLALPTN